METLASQILNSGLSRAYSPWWVDLDEYGRGNLRVKCWDHEVSERHIDEATGEGVKVVNVTGRQLYAAHVAAALDGALCCAGEPYCAEDADQVLQRAAYGRTVYG